MGTSQRSEGVLSSTAPPSSMKSRPGMGAILALLLSILVIVFAVLNTQTVRVHWVFFTTRAPLVAVIAVSGLIGAAIAGILAYLRRRSTSRRGAG